MTDAATAAPPPPHDAAPSGRTAIVGGGMLGLALALRLAERGEPVTVLESAGRLGGLAEPWTVGDVTWDRHYHVALYSDLALRRLLREIGLESDVRWTTVGTGFYTDGRFHPMNGALDFLRFPALGLVDKARLALTILGGSRIADPAPLERISVEAWLVRRSGRRTFEKLWRPLLRAKLGERYRDASAAFIWAIIVRLSAARRAGVGAERFGYVPGGYGRVLERLEARLRELGVEIETGARVAAVRHDPATGVTIEDGFGAARRFARAIVTVAAPLAGRMLPQLDPDARARLDGKVYGGIVCASLVLDRPLGPYYVTNLTDDWVPFTGVIDMSAVVDRAEWGGAALVYLPKYVRPDDPIFERSDADVEESFLAALERMYPDFTRARVRAVRISRVRHVFPIATLGYSDTIPPIATSIPGVFVLNSAHIVNGTLNVNETILLAERGLAVIDAAGRPA